MDAMKATPEEAREPSARADELAGDDQKPVDPQEQALYDKVMQAALTQLYGDDTTHQGIVTALKGDPKNLAQTVGHIAAMMLRSIVGNAKKSGVEIPEDVVFNAGLEVVAEIVTIAEAMKLVDEAGGQKLFQDAIMYGTKSYGEAMLNAGEVTPEMQQQAKQTIAQNAAAEKQKPGAIEGAMQEEA
jgi:hypothetical protein